MLMHTYEVTKLKTPKKKNPKIKDMKKPYTQADNFFTQTNYLPKNKTFDKHYFKIFTTI